MIRYYFLVSFLLLYRCQPEHPPKDQNACNFGQQSIRSAWQEIETRINTSLESNSWCFKEPTELKPLIERAIQTLETLSHEVSPQTAVKDIHDPRWTEILASIKNSYESELTIARDLQCPETPMLTAFQAAHQIVESTQTNAPAALTLLDDQQNPVDLPWTPQVLLLAIKDDPSKIESQITSQRIQRQRSTQLVGQIHRLIETISQNSEKNKVKQRLQGIDNSLVPILHRELEAATRITQNWITSCL